MAAIEKRTVFYDNTGGVVRFWDWAVVVTALGNMAEPFMANSRMMPSGPIVEFDPTDEFSRIDEIRAKPIDKEKFVLSGSTDATIGGYQFPRDNKR